MAGIVDLEALLSCMRPTLSETEYVFCTIADARYGALAECHPLATFQEAEGLTLVLPHAAADAAGLAYEGRFRMITLGVHSSLQAVGLTAAVASCLAERGISANVIAAYHHDHVFVPSERASAAIEALQALATGARRR